MAVKTKPDGVSSAALADLFGCTKRQIELLAAEGVVVRRGRGAYDRDASTRNYIRRLREQAAGRAGQVATIDPVAANVRLRTAQAELTELRTQKERAEVLPRIHVRMVWGEILRGLRQRILALPNQIAFEVPHLTPHDRITVDRLVKEGLEDAAMERGFDITPEAEEPGLEDQDE